MDREEFNRIVVMIKTKLWQVKDKLPESDGKILLEVIMHEGGVRKINVQTVLN